jgi:hypothetical protein
MTDTAASRTPVPRAASHDGTPTAVTDPDAAALAAAGRRASGATEDLLAAACSRLQTSIRLLEPAHGAERTTQVLR